MRSLLLLSCLLAAATACNQSLTSDRSGTGGAPTGAGATGGSSPGTGGSNVTQPCDTLIAEYRSALTAGETCQVGASGQCQQIVSGALSGCSCPTYVTDSSALSMIADAWRAAGCVVPGPVCNLSCPAALNTTCVAADGGSVGFCSYVAGDGGTSGAGGTSGTDGSGGRGGTGGTTGSGGSPVDGGGLSSCGIFASEYAAVLAGAKSCTAGATGQCGQLVSSSLSPCNSGCAEFVTDSSILDGIRNQWNAAGCANVKVLCPLIACAAATGVACVASDAGGAVCSTTYGEVSFN